MQRSLIALALAGAALGLPPGALAQATPAGLWKTIDDDGKTEKSLVRITEAGGVFSAKIEKIFDPAKQDARCEKCSDERKDQPVVGLSIVRGVKASPSDPALWDGGEILDPNNGKTYKVRMKPIDGGRRLEVRGYIGAPLLGRTQTWVRVD
jgi:uncharacterized protein (DUF2147 family)